MKRGRKPVQVKGEHGLKGEKIMRDALHKIIKERMDGEEGRPRRLEYMVRKLVGAACEGEPWAIQMVFDRMDGKPRNDGEIRHQHKGEVTYTFAWSGDDSDKLLDITPETETVGDA